MTEYFAEVEATVTGTAPYRRVHKIPAEAITEALRIGLERTALELRDRPYTKIQVKIGEHVLTLSVPENRDASTAK
ncbi:MAG TPA: hypothetical protein VMU65_02965 [Candidatus Saccharimonadales bacterium]|nr:hypothetical protein [Candidatus Saccharimonadales bacterium]